jgi:hypothetical protein
MSTCVDLDGILKSYSVSFSSKTYGQENEDSDLLMKAFGITPELKRENRQYWGRELGKCWESLVIRACLNSEGFKPALRIGADEPCDLRVGSNAIDTKYRVGSGDSGTLKKFRQYGALLIEHGYQPVFLFLREDNLPAAITACKAGGWRTLFGDESFDFIEEVSGFDMKNFLLSREAKFSVARLP